MPSTEHNSSTDVQSVVNDLRDLVSHASSAPPNIQASESIDEKKRKLKIENDNAENDQKLKRLTLVLLFVFLAFETAAIFVLAFFQGFKTGGFNIDSWSFRLVVTATIGQITTMLIIAVHHLFPAPEKKKK
jgi:hypothetical protein